MRPMTKEQERIVRWTNQTGAPTPKQIAYAKRHCFEGEILESRGTHFCTACKHVWKDTPTDEREMKCPHCGKTLQIYNRHRKIKRLNYYVVMTTRNKMQVLAWYLVTRVVSQTCDDFKFKHVGTEWIKQDGKFFSVELPRFTMTYRCDQWIHNADMALRKTSTFARYIAPSAVYVARVLPVLKRNGWKAHKLESCIDTLIINLLKSKEFESYFKIGHYGVCYDWLCQDCDYRRGIGDKPRLSADQRVMVKLANRKHVVFDTKNKWIDYKDYLKDLQTLNQDIHNPSILFPDNFQEVHQQVSQRALAKRARERVRDRREREIRDMQQKEKRAEVAEWLAQYAACFGDMQLQCCKFTIRPLVSRGDFILEADRMHHCIETYYGKRNTLLLSIEHNGKKCETAEINLLGTGRLVQCRGVCNQPSDYHNEIVGILNDFMPEFERRFNKPFKQQTLPVPISHYQHYSIAI